MFGQFSDQARRAVVSSREESRRLSHHYIGSEHLLLALISQRETQAGKALAAAGLTLSGAREEVERLTGRGRGRSPGHLPFTAHVKTILETATYAAQRRRQNSLTPEHLLLALLVEDEGRGARVVRELGADPALLLEQATALSDTTPPTSDDDLTSRVSALEEQVNALTEQVTELRRRLGA
jgi:ATP-dependent Clp protease ATP-binding subunit ClpC